MNIQQSTFKTRDKRRTQYPHISREHYQVGGMALDGVGQRSIKNFAAGVCGVIQRQRNQPLRTRKF